MDFKKYIREVPDLPKPGIGFKDISPLLADGPAFRYAVNELASRFKPGEIDKLVGIESRGFLVGAPLAYAMNVGIALVRKPGKLPGCVERIEYALEYGTDALEIHRDAIEPGTKVLIVDDVLATGGTMSATAQLVRKVGGEIAGFAFLLELDFLKGREKLGELGDTHIVSLIHY
mgnify:FL=1